MYVSVYVWSRRCIKTQLEVPDNRLCNVVTLSDLPTRMKQSLPCAGKVWPLDLDEYLIASLYLEINVVSEAKQQISLEILKEWKSCFLSNFYVFFN